MDLSRVRELFERPGPFATVYLEARQAEEYSPKQVQLRWRDLRRQLSEAGADDAVLDALGGELDTDEAGAITANGRVLVASSDGGVLFDEPVEGVAVAGDVAAWSPLPELGLYVRAQSGTVRALLAVVDQTGGDLYQLVGANDEGAREVGEETVGPVTDEKVHKPRDAGAVRGMQRRHEMASYENAEAVVSGMRSAASSFRPQVVLLAGEVQGRQAVHSQLPTELASITQELEHGSRAAGASEDALEDEMLTRLGAVATEQETEVRERLREGEAHATAVEGFERVLEAARAGAVDTLVLVDGTAVPGELWAGSAPEMLSTAKETVAEMSTTTPVRRPAEQVLLRAVAAFGGDVSVLGGGTSLTDNVGALLRFPVGS